MKSLFKSVRLKTVCASLMAMTMTAASLPAHADDWHRRGDGWRGHGRYYDHRHGGGDGAAIAIGVGVLALGLAAVAASSAHDQPRRAYDPYYDDADYAPPPAYVEPRYRESRYVEDSDSCLQTREYQTTVTIDGRRERAYGTACLQPDGSWLRGPAQLDY